jgi:hypothetical protein
MIVDSFPFHIKHTIFFSIFLSFTYINLCSQSLLIEKKVYSAKEGVQKVLKIPINLKTRNKNLDLQILDLAEGTATQTQDYKITSLLNCTLSPANSFTYVLTIDISTDADKEEEETIKLHVLFKNYETDETSDSTINITIIDKDAIDKKANEANTNINRFEFVQYTDFLGFDADRPNGLLQQEFRFKWAINAPFNKEWYGKGWLKWRPFRSIILPDILFNRIDKSSKELNYPLGITQPTNASAKDSIRPYTTTMDILKYSNLNIGGRVIIAAFKADNFRFHLQYGFKLLRNRPFIADTIKTGPDSGRIASDYRPFYSFIHQIELYGKTSLNKEDINLSFFAGIMWIRMKDSYYKQFDAAVVDPLNRATALLPANNPAVKRNSKPIWYYNIQLEKDWGKENANATFFRVNYFYQKGNYQRLLNGTANRPPTFVNDRFHNHFLQLQLGVKLGLDKIFKTKEEKKPEGKEKKTNTIDTI